ncbi:unnamed protein product [Macrosiphum euphorbiae]|uniref:Uncharacterized protein n=1 Tax=Macrosiphum euphorbiae TaxID=13131 RepID=A0AAV0XSQ4_9HEMI|nr:unnamed protein product [Macrosiphum euphorbiae]
MNKNELKKKTSINHLGKRVTLAAIETKPEKCACCSQTHRIYACKKFKDLPQSERFNVVRSARMCFNCLSSYHMAPQCQSNSTCQVCRVHRGKPQDEDDLVNSEQSGSDSIQAHSYIAARPKRSHIFLSTTEVLVTDSKGCKRKCRAVLDSGSMINFAARSLLSALQLPTRKTELPIRGVGASQIQSVALVNIQVGSRVLRVTKSGRRSPFMSNTKGWLGHPSGFNIQISRYQVL